jgi:hypothetical protein
MAKNESYNMAVEALERRIDELALNADDVVKGHWAAVKATEAGMSGMVNKSTLQVRSVKDGNSIRADWCGVEWWGAKSRGTRTKIRHPISKPADSHMYSLTKLCKHCKEWEKPLVKDTEEKLAIIRREARHINKALQQLRFAREASKRQQTHPMDE